MSRETRERWVRLDQGLPPTDHEVTIHEVRPFPYEPDPYPPYLVAICEGDDWMEFPRTGDGTDLDADEADLRAQAGQHTSNVLPGRFRPVG